jgi:transcriptional regulator with XRE-family HTH domain
MADGDWRKRLEAAIERSGKSERALSRAIGRSAGYVNQILNDGKEPGIDSLVALATELDMSASELIYGVRMSASAEKLLRLFGSLTTEQQDQFLQMAESAAALAGRKVE